VNILSIVIALCRLRRFDVLVHELRRRIRFDLAYIGGALDLTDFEGLAKVGRDLSLRPIEAADNHYFTDFTNPELDVIGVLSRINAARRLGSGMSRCYVVVRGDGRPCHMEYLVRAPDFHRLDELFPGRMPPLAEDDALLEYPYTLEECRGRGIALFAMAALADTARAEGIRRLIMFAPADNPEMLKLCEWAGFVPFVERTESYRLFRSRMTFKRLPAGTPYPRPVAAPARAKARTTDAG
jgi:GNAT superfamily N-acetyltransferase